MNYISYFEWLLSQVECDEQLGELLDAMTYSWHFILDENRSAGGLELRKIYGLEYSVDLDDVKTGPCSVLEMFVALAMRFSENADISVSKAFHEMISNLQEVNSNSLKVTIQEWMNGNFSPDGYGSPFILQYYTGDARDLDVWTLMTIYISEHYSLPEDWLQ